MFSTEKYKVVDIDGEIHKTMIKYATKCPSNLQTLYFRLKITHNVELLAAGMWNKNPKPLKFNIIDQLNDTK